MKQVNPTKDKMATSHLYFQALLISVKKYALHALNALNVLHALHQFFRWIKLIASASWIFQVSDFLRLFVCLSGMV